VDAEHASAVSDIAPGMPDRRMTWMVFPCCEYTDNVVAVHPAGTQVKIVASSFALAFALFTE
jgi:hypothetical protein